MGSLGHELAVEARAGGADWPTIGEVSGEPGAGHAVGNGEGGEGAGIIPIAVSFILKPAGKRPVPPRDPPAKNQPPLG